MNTLKFAHTEREIINYKIEAENVKLDGLIAQNQESPSEYLDNCIAATQTKINELWAELRTLPVSKTI